MNIKKMDKKAYIIPRMNSRHMILGGAIAQVPAYGDTGASTDGSNTLTKERNEDVAEAEGWNENGLW